MFKHVYVSFQKLLSADVHIHFLVCFFFRVICKLFFISNRGRHGYTEYHPYSDPQTFLCGRYQEEAKMLA